MCCSVLVLFLKMCTVFQIIFHIFVAGFGLSGFSTLCGLVHRRILTFQKSNLTLKDAEKLRVRNHHLFLLSFSFAVIINGVRTLVILVFSVA